MARRSLAECRQQCRDSELSCGRSSRLVDGGESATGEASAVVVKVAIVQKSRGRGALFPFLLLSLSFRPRRPRPRPPRPRPPHPALGLPLRRLRQALLRGLVLQGHPAWRGPGLCADLLHRGPEEGGQGRRRGVRRCCCCCSVVAVVVVVVVVLLLFFLLFFLFFLFLLEARGRRSDNGPRRLLPAPVRS